MSGDTEMDGGSFDDDVLIVGAGFAGIYALHKLRSAGFRARVIEAGSDVGGVWYWNRYPGARCDVESLQYSYSFCEQLDKEWAWSEHYATQPEIQSYISFVADRLDLRRDITFETRVKSAQFDAERNAWTVETDAGSRSTARFLVLATGALSSSRMPDIPGRGDFGGELCHTGRWPAGGVDLEGKRVAVIGTGSSGIQAIPVIAAQAEHLFVFQRTPHFTVPAHNRAISPERRALWASEGAELRKHIRNTRSGVLYDYGQTSALAVSTDEREREYALRWSKGGTNFLYAYRDIMRDAAANETAARFVRARIGEIVDDPEIARRLTPTDYPIGAKRICVDTDFYATFNRDNVTLVSTRDTPIERITPVGIRTTEREYAVDVVIFATGYDALTGSITAIDIRGADGTSIGDAWAAGPYTYLGLMTANFPNMFIVTGPGSPSVLSNMVVSIEHDAEWITDTLDYLRATGASRIEATREAQTEWMTHVADLAADTLYGQGDSWYLGANVPGKPRVFMPYLGGVDVYRKKCAEVAADGYPGFLIDGAAR